MDVISAGDDSAGTIIGVVDHVDPASPQVRDAVAGVAQRLAGFTGVRAVDQPFALPPAQAARLLSADGHAVAVAVTLAKLDRSARDTAAIAITDELHRLTSALPPGATVEVGGGPVLSQRNRPGGARDLARAEYLSLPITLIVLVLVFGGLVAAGLPVLAAAVSVAAAMGVMLGFSTFTDVDQDGVTVVTLLGLGLAVDYGLLLVARYREDCWPATRPRPPSRGPGRRPDGRSCSAP
jgi:RND superfamily putative drug exporter